MKRECERRSMRSLLVCPILTVFIAKLSRDVSYANSATEEKEAIEDFRRTVGKNKRPRRTDETVVPSDGE